MAEIGSLVKEFLQLHTNEQKLRKQVTETSKMTKESKVNLIEAMESSDLKRIRALSNNADIILVEKPKKNTLSCKNIKQILLEHDIEEHKVESILERMTTKSDAVNKMLKIKKVTKDTSQVEVLDD